MKVRYWWSEDGECELCEHQKVTAEEQCRCYHCDQEIPAGAACVKLQTNTGEVYLLHKECGKNGIQFL